MHYNLSTTDYNEWTEQCRCGRVCFGDILNFNTATCKHFAAQRLAALCLCCLIKHSSLASIHIRDNNNRNFYSPRAVWVSNERIFRWKLLNYHKMKTNSFWNRWIRPPDPYVYFISWRVSRNLNQRPFNFFCRKIKCHFEYS